MYYHRYDVCNDATERVERAIAEWHAYVTLLVITLCVCSLLFVPTVALIWLITSASQNYASSLTLKTKQLRRDKKT